MKRLVTAFSIAIGISLWASHVDAGQIPFHQAGKARLKHAAQQAGRAVLTDVAHCGKRHHGHAYHRQRYRGGYGYGHPHYRGYRGGYLSIGAPVYYGGYGGYGYGLPRSCGYGGYGGYGYGGGFGLQIGW